MLIFMVLVSIIYNSKKWYCKKWYWTRTSASLVVFDHINESLAKVLYLVLGRQHQASVLVAFGQARHFWRIQLTAVGPGSNLRHLRRSITQGLYSQLKNHVAICRYAILCSQTGENNMVTLDDAHSSVQFPCCVMDGPGMHHGHALSKLNGQRSLRIALKGNQNPQF